MLDPWPVFVTARVTVDRYIMQAEPFVDSNGCINIYVKKFILF